MVVALSPVEWHFVFVYLDGKVFFPRFAAEHIDHVKTYFNAITQFNDHPGAKISNFFTRTVDHLSYVTCSRRSEIASHTRDAVKELNAPLNATKLKSFLGFFKVSKRFVSDFAIIASPLNDKSRNDQPTELEKSGSNEETQRECDLLASTGVTVRQGAHET